MERNYLEEILRDQKEDYKILLDRDYCPRCEEKLINLNSSLAQVVIGVRRSGKTTLCLNVIKQSSFNFAYVNFDDERFENIKAEDLNTLLACLYQIYGDFNHLFLDEIQNVPSWTLFVNRLLRRGMHILLTGSNAKLLSGELASHLTGRHIQIELYPFSFSEYYLYKKKETAYETTKEKGLLRGVFDEYMHIGGLPELYSEPSPETYVNTIYNNIISNDIINRYKIRYKATFKKLTDHLLNTAPVKVNGKELQKIFNVGSDHTIENYIQYLENAYLLLSLSKFSYKSKMRIKDNKVYPINIAFMNLREESLRGNNLGWRLETIVLLELLRRYRPQGYAVFYYSEAAYEVDFVLCKKNKVKKLIQVSFNISDTKKLKRELTALEKASQKLKCNDLLLLALYADVPEKKQKDGILIMDVISWLISSRDA